MRLGTVDQNYCLSTGDSFCYSLPGLWQARFAHCHEPTKIFRSFPVLIDPRYRRMTNAVSGASQQPHPATYGVNVAQAAGQVPPHVQDSQSTSGVATAIPPTVPHVGEKVSLHAACRHVTTLSTSYYGRGVTAALLRLLLCSRTGRYM